MYKTLVYILFLSLMTGDIYRPAINYYPQFLFIGKVALNLQLVQNPVRSSEPSLESFFHIKTVIVLLQYKQARVPLFLTSSL